jgi:histidinol-phosphate/aromatic aminotransferase/cobyric acid decarboxylase-like protein
MSQEPTDSALDALLRRLERHYVSHAARLFRAYGIPEPLRLPDPSLPESGAALRAKARARPGKPQQITPFNGTDGTLSALSSSALKPRSTKKLSR